MIRKYRTVPLFGFLGIECGSIQFSAICVAFRSAGFLQFPLPVGNLVCGADSHPSLPGDLERYFSFASRCWPVVVYFVLSGLGERRQLGVSCGVSRLLSVLWFLFTSVVRPDMISISERICVF